MVRHYKTDCEVSARDEYHYARQKLWEAVNVLVGDGAIRDRLGFAQNYLSLLRPDEDLPEFLRPQFRSLMADLSNRAVYYTYRPTRIATRHPKSGKMAQMILSMYTDLRGGI